MALKNFQKATSGQNSNLAVEMSPDFQYFATKKFGGTPGVPSDFWKFIGAPLWDFKRTQMTP